jgi:endonuclease III
MNKVNVKLDALKKTVVRLIKAAPSRKPEPVDPLARLIRAFLEYDCDEARASAAERKIQENMVDFNELRVTPAIELAALLGVRYPFAESRCSALHRTLQSVFDREHHMRLDRLKEMKKPEIRPYLQSLAGINPYVEAAVCVDCFGICAAPVDTKLLLWLISKDALPEGIDIKTAQHHVEKMLKATEAEDFFHGARKELEGWSPKSWPQVAKVPSPILAPPPIEGAIEANRRAPQPPIPPQEPAKPAPRPIAVVKKK